MSEPTSAVRSLGRRLLEREAGRGGDSEAWASAAAGACLKLSLHLNGLIGAAGYRALLRRALHLARLEFALLQPVDVAADPDIRLTNLHEAMRDADPIQAPEALAAVLTHLAWLLITFIGESLALQILRQAWPDVDFGEAGAGPQEATA